MMAELQKAGIEATDLVSQHYGGSIPHTLEVAWDAAGHEAHFPHLPVPDDATLAERGWTRFRCTTDHLLLWQRKPSKEEGEDGPLTVEDVAVAKLELEKTKKKTAAGGDGIGWEGLSQGISDHRGVSCTLSLTTGHYLPSPPVNGFQSPVPFFLPIVPADVYVSPAPRTHTHSVHS